MSDYYTIESDTDYYGVKQFRYVSLYNGARGRWTSKLIAEEHGEKHKKIVIKIIKGEVDE